ncbi:MAG: hypothetical protein KDK35_11760 [Leptospiraceae bacterium]|nr:hypothetical protein [Leptospiraceae bacterium]MCP5486842.1 hypothetical protein [Spirochaetales bacterium]
MRFAIGLILFALCTVSCQGLVDESYATREKKSINGTDAFYAILEETGETFSAASLSDRVLKQADLLVYFEDPVGDEQSALNFQKKFEAWAFDLDPESLPDEAREVASRMGENPTLAGADEPGPLEGENRDRTLLFFIADTTSGTSFWERTATQMEDYQEQRDYCLAHLESRRYERSRPLATNATLFGFRQLRYEGGPVVQSLRADRVAFPHGVSGFPVRYVPGPITTHFAPEEINPVSRSLLETGRGEDLVREIRTPRARLIVVYNSEPFLNYNLVRPSGRNMARDLVHYAARSPTHAGSRPTIAFITGLPLPSATAAEDENPYAMFLVYPLNIIFIHAGLLLVLFLVSRWPHHRPPLKARPAGTREFLEHINALGLKLMRSRESHKALEPLLTIRRRSGLEPDTIEETAATMNSNTRETK